MHNNPYPDKFYTLPVAFNVLGRERYGEAWTGLEIGAHRLPDLDTILPDVMEADARPGIFTMAELRRRSCGTKDSPAMTAEKDGCSIPPCATGP